MCVQLEAEAASSTRASGPRCSRARPRRGALPRFVQRRLPPARAAHVPHHRRQGVAGVDLPGRLQGAQCAGVIHGDFERGFIRAEVIRWDELLEHRLVDQGQGGRQAPRRGQGLRGPGRRRPRDPLQRLTADVVDGLACRGCSRRGGAGVAGGGRPRRARRKGLLGRDGIEGRSCSPARSVHTIGMRFRSTWPGSTTTSRVRARRALARNRVTPPRAGAPRGARGRGRLVRRWGLRPGRPARGQGAERAASCWSARRSATSATCRPAPSRRSPRPTPSAARTRGAPAGCSSTPASSGPRLIVVNDHTEAGPSPGVLERLGRGERVAVVTDAGMPGISDPGERLVRAAVEAGHRSRWCPGRRRRRRRSW